MSKKRLLSAATCAAAVAVVVASAALAGEVTGPPGKGNVTPKDMSHPNSICAFSGLNDYVDGPEDFLAQAFGQDVRLYDADPSAFNPGDACRGGSNPARP
jgi:hypothetical protein